MLLVVIAKVWVSWWLQTLVSFLGLFPVWSFLAALLFSTGSALLSLALDISHGNKYDSCSCIAEPENDSFLGNKAGNGKATPLDRVPILNCID